MSINTPIAYAIPLAIPILMETDAGFSSRYRIRIDEIIANGNEKVIVFWAIDLPINLIVRSVATTINGKLNAAHVILKL